MAINRQINLLDFFQVQVRSLGWVELREDELTPENSSKAVNRCIIQLSSANSSNSPISSGVITPVPLQDPIGQWGEGKELTLELNEGSLKLIQPQNGMVLNSQPIHSIRVWGVGRDNGQDFAYVARDKHTRKHMCHVFRCDIPARAIANALRDICKKILIERSLAQSSSRLTGLSVRIEDPSNPNSSNPSSSSNSFISSKPHNGSSIAVNGGKKIRPTSLGGNFNASKLQTKTIPIPESFPTPMEEPRKVMRALYLGTMQVDKPCGMDVINHSIDSMMDTIPRGQWKAVSVAVAPSTVTVSFKDGNQENLECRVRFLSFLGIGENVNQCAYIMHTAQDTFLAHVFHCDSGAGPLCKTIEAACKLRYQKCLDARPQRSQGLEKGIPGQEGQSQGGNKSIGATLKNMFGSWKSRGGSSSGQIMESPPPKGS